MEKNELMPTLPGNLVPDYADEKQLELLVNTGSGTQIGTVEGDYVVKLEIKTENEKLALQDLLNLGKKNKCTVEELATMHQEKFNVFVIENENFKNGAFTLPKSTCLKKHMSGNNLKLYEKASPEELLSLRRYPCIFATRNINYTRTSEQHIALLGRITDVICQKKVIKFTFEVCLEVKQNKLNANARYLGLFARDTRNELDDSGWTVKDGNLLNKLQMIGIDLSATR